MSRRGPAIYGKLKSWQIRKKLRKRDGDLCWICEKYVSEDFPENHSSSATVDHIFERSRGGTDDIHNLALAHKICNHLRSARTGFKKLLIIIEHTVYNLEFFSKTQQLCDIFDPTICYSLCYLRYKIQFLRESISLYELNYLICYIEICSEKEQKYALDILMSIDDIPDFMIWKINEYTRKI